MFELFQWLYVLLAQHIISVLHAGLGMTQPQLTSALTVNSLAFAPAKAAPLHNTLNKISQATAITSLPQLAVAPLGTPSSSAADAPLENGPSSR